MSIIHRSDWVQWMVRLSEPVLTLGANDRLRSSMPIESQPDQTTASARRSPLEAVARLLAGMAPWLGSEITDPVESAERDRLLELAQRTLWHIADPSDADYLSLLIGFQQCLKQS